ncbi:uncharacterized protein LOC113871120 [Abrus precatorius]|uniref:Uncharacterized protein LOC113871120 n=1 Tax=Abrus precatorius TaxID=3816 RepID=A0A8B8M6T1_ABRPR|nr:uncharacterized protein LOC113871120 [Abrus precatorius]
MQMASTKPINTKEIVAEIPTYIRVFSDGTVERPRQAPFVPALLDDPRTGISSKDIVISHDPSISARLFLPKFTTFSDQDQVQKVPILVYFHGGGFFFESAFSQLYHDHFNTFVSQTNVIVVSVEYRLAPEHPLPACYHDCWAALQWVASNSAKNHTNAEPWLIQHGDFNRIFIGGDSAGGNIVHNIAMRAGTEALPCGVKILGAILSHPYFCSSDPIGPELVTRPEENLSYLIWNFVYPSAPGGIDNPMVNPVAPGAPSLALLGCSKIIVCVAGKDNVRDRGVWYYEIVKKSGWQGKLELFEETEEDHVYHIFHPESANATKLIKRLASFLHDSLPSMASTTTSKEIDRELPPLLRVYKDGTVERFLGSSFVPPTPQDPETGVSSKDIVISQNPSISARVYLPKLSTPENKKLPILVYYHGGAFCLESAFSFLHQRYLNIVASQANVLVVSVEYRLAPEHPLPAAYEDGWDALKWVTSHSTNNVNNSEAWLINHGDFNRFYIGGDTAGANIAHYAALRVGGGVETLPGGVKIAGALLAFPLFWGSKPILSEPVEGHEESSPMQVWNFVYPDAPGGIDNPLINPLASGAPSLATFGCPRILIFVAGKDDLRDRGIWYYDAVKQSGWQGEVELVHVEGEEHCFQIYHPETQNSKNMIARMASFLV